jgi:hypothetical protein
MHTIRVRQCNCTYLRNCVFICKKNFFKYESEYSGNRVGSIVIVLDLCWPAMFENKYFDQWSSEHSLYYALMEYLMDK